MAAEFSVEVNAKKIQTLTKVAKLLRDQIQEQNKKIDNLQEEIVKIREAFERITIPSVSMSPQPKESSDQVTTSSDQLQPFQSRLQITEKNEFKKEKPVSVLTEKTTDKEELLRALKIIDDL